MQGDEMFVDKIFMVGTGNNILFKELLCGD